MDEIRAKHITGRTEPFRVIAARYGVSRFRVAKILAGEAWRGDADA